MSPSETQGELLPPNPPGGTEPTLAEVRDFFAKEALRVAEEIGALKQQMRVQRTLVVGTLLGVLVLAGSVNLLTLKQMRMMRDQLYDTRPRVDQMYREFRQRREPVVSNLVARLQGFAETHRDFQPTLERYRPFLPQYFRGPAAPPPVPPKVEAPIQPPRQPPAPK